MKYVLSNKLAACIGALCLTTCLPIYATAQDAAEQAEDGAQGGAIVVTGTPLPDSPLASTEAQRRADNVPDATAAGALARLPGVGVQRDQGQEGDLQIRAAPSRWTQVSLDGVNVLGAEDRIFRFDSVPAVQIGRLELNKTLLPGMPAEALAGRVDIKAYSPIDNPGFHFSGDFGEGIVDLGQVRWTVSA
jgi:outer membrane cobalamin receptor